MEIVLPDGSKKTLEAGATVADVAASIGAGLARAALGGKIDGAFADLDTPVADGAHARFDAREREYRYFIEPHKNPFTRHLSWQYYVPLDVGRMNEAAAMLAEFDDFTSFAKLNSNNKTNRCRIMHAAWTVDDSGVLCFTIRADRFLRNMVRAIVGTLVDVGRGRYSPHGFRVIVESRDLSRSSAGAPAQGLFLSDVRYPPEVFSRVCAAKHPFR